VSAPRPILVHGVLGGTAAWTPLDGVFAGAAAVALPGHGGGPPHGDLAATAGWLGDLVARLPGPRALVGQDLGAAVALALAASRPDLVDGVVALGCGASLPVPPDARARADAGDAAGALAALLDGGPGPSDLAAALTGRVAAPALAADLALCAAADPLAVAPGVRCPVLLVAGEGDRWVTPASVEALARALPVCQMTLVPGAGHLVQGDAPDTVNLLLGAYLARLELTPADG
jgi:pimeloyl-ACP methyl ester carboxylesterase